MCCNQQSNSDPHFMSRLKRCFFDCAKRNFNWHFFIDNLLYVSDQINDHCDDSDEQFTILHYACYMGYEEVVKLLLSLYDKNGASIDAQQSSIDVNVQDKYKRTPLHLAILNQKVEIVKILFEYNDTNFVQRISYP